MRFLVVDDSTTMRLVIINTLNNSAARTIIGSMLRMEAADVDGETPEAIGEITNMIAGTFRTRMAAFGPRWAISIPTVTIGSDFYPKLVSDVRRVLCPFTMSGGDEIFGDLILTQN